MSKVSRRCQCGVSNKAHSRKSKRHQLPPIKPEKKEGKRTISWDNPRRSIDGGGYEDWYWPIEREIRG